MSSPDLTRSLIAAVVADPEALAQLAAALDEVRRPTPASRLLTVHEAAERLHLHPNSVRAMARDGRLDAQRIGSQWRIPEDALAALDQRPEQAARSAPRPPRTRRGPAQRPPARARPGAEAIRRG